MCWGGANASDDLNPKVEHLDKIDVYDVGITTYQQINAPLSVSVVTAQDLEKNNYKNVHEAISDISGVYNAGFYANIRGIANGVIYLIDGKPTKTIGAYADTNIFPPLNQIERIEVIRGSTGALYGNALGGVINVITKKVPKEWILNAHQSVSLYQRETLPNTSFSLSGPLIDNVLGLSLGGNINKDILIWALDKDDHLDTKGRKIDNKKFDGKLNWIINENNELVLSYLRNGATHTQYKVFTEINNRNVNRSVIKDSTFNLEHLGHYGKLETNTYVQGGKYTHVDDKVSNDGDPINEKEKEKEYIFHTQGKYLFESNTLNFGYEYKDTKNTDSDDKITHFKASSFFLTDDYYLTDSLTLSFGGRFDINKGFKNHFSPRIYTVYTLNENITFKGGVSTGYKNPSVWELISEPTEQTHWNHPDIINRVALPNPNLKPETSINYELGFSYNDEKMGFDATAFYIDYKDKIEENYICEKGNPWNLDDMPNWGCDYKGQKVAQIFINDNVSKVGVYGAELSAFYKILENLKTTVNYAYTSGKQKENGDNTKYWPQANRNALSVKLDYAPIAKLDLWAKYTNMSRGPWEGIRAYSMTDLGLAYQYNKNTSITASAYNVFNANINRAWADNARGVKYTFGVNISF